MSQSNYTVDLLHDIIIIGSHGVATPMTSITSLFQNLGSSIDENNYRRIIGKLQYLSFMRPDIAYIVNRLSQFMYKLMKVHWQAVKRLLRYLNQTCNHGLHISRTKDARLLVYSDSDWTGDPVDQTSITCYIVYLGSTPISWS